MEQLKQIKSKQFQKHSAEDQFIRTSSFHHIENKRKQQLALQNAIPESSAENQLDLANIVQEILEMKPKTAFIGDQRRSEAKYRARVETIGSLCMQAELNGPKQGKPISILQILKNQREKSEQCRKQSIKKPELRQQLIKIDNRASHTIEPHITSRTKSSYKSSTHINFDTINPPHGKSKKPSNKDGVLPSHKPEPLWKEELDIGQQWCRADQKGVKLPKSKLTINNIDKFVSVQGKASSQSKKKLFNGELKKNSSKHESLIETDKTKDLIQAVVAEKKIKKNVIGSKIPDFIKASLEIYQQDSQFKRVFQKIVVRNAGTVPIEKQPEPDMLALQEPQPYSCRELQEQDPCAPEDNFPSSQKNLEGAKVRLLSKEKKRTTRIGDYIRSKREQVVQKVEEEEVHRQISGARKRSKMRSKGRERLMEASNEEICGWQQTDVVTVETLQFKN